MSGSKRWVQRPVPSEEGFRQVEGFGLAYIVNAVGEVRSRWRSGRALKQRTDKDGYRLVPLMDDGRKRYVPTARDIFAAAALTALLPTHSRRCAIEEAFEIADECMAARDGKKGAP